MWNFVLINSGCLFCRPNLLSFNITFVLCLHVYMSTLCTCVQFNYRSSRYRGHSVMWIFVLINSGCLFCRPNLLSFNIIFVLCLHEYMSTLCICVQFSYRSSRYCGHSVMWNFVLINSGCLCCRSNLLSFNIIFVLCLHVYMSTLCTSVHFNYRGSKICGPRVISVSWSIFSHINCSDCRIFVI